MSSLPAQRDEFDERIGPDRQLGYGQEAKSAAFGGQADPNYSTFEEGEAAFMKLLKRSNVQPDWTWDQTMKATIKDAQYRALKDPKDRKAAFEKYAIEVRAQEKDREKERFEKLRKEFGVMLRRHPEIKHYTRWKTARPIIEGETTFRSTNDDTERRQLFEEYIVELKKANIESEAIKRKSAMDELVGLLKSLDLEPYTRWSDAHDAIQENPKFKGDEKFKTLSKSDILTAFENHIKSLERTFNDTKQKEKNSKARRERQNRDAFLALLHDLKIQGKIKAGTKWMSIHSLVASSPAYEALLGQPGSTPLDLFWDIVEEEERSVRMLRNDVYDVLEDKRYEVTPKTTLEQFMDVMATDRRTVAMPPDTLSLIFSRIQEKVNKRAEEDKHASLRHQRHQIDALRSRIKHLSAPPVTLSSTWDDVRPAIAHLDEFKVLDSEDARKQAFEKVLRRLREKEEDAERRRTSREVRNGSGSHDAGHRRRTVTPELDAYEADRRKAMADRERQYQKAGHSGLSPPPHSHHERDRERDRDRDRRGYPPDLDPRRLSQYDRETRHRDRDDRRDRERDRDFDDRPPRVRGPPLPREKVDYGDQGLDYGDGSGRLGGPGGGRRRRDSNGSMESRKRRRRDDRRARTRTPETVAKQEKVEEKEEVGMRSGSEEGEMVEE